jgi:hypothetical protein
MRGGQIERTTAATLWRHLRRTRSRARRPDGRGLANRATMPQTSRLAAAQNRVLADATRATIGIIAAIPAWKLSRPIARELADRMLAEGVRSALTGMARWWWHNRDTTREDVVAVAYDLLYTGLDRLCQAPPPPSSSPMGDAA